MDIKSAIALSIIRTLGLMNLRVARRFGRFIGWLLRVTGSRMYKVTLKNLELCYPDMPQAEREALAKQSVSHTGQTIAEAGLAWGGTDAKFRRNEAQILKVTNGHLLDAAKAKGKGVMLLTLHHGNWEWLSSWLPRRTELLALYKMAKMPGLEKAMLEARSSSGLDLVASGKDGVLKFINHYVAQKDCIIAPDQEPSEKSGVWAKFFGIDALTPKFIHHLIHRNPEGTVLFIYMKRIEGGFEVVMKEAPAEIYDEDLVVSATAMNKGFEDCIADAPEQYEWDYKRFKRNPERYYQGL